MVSLVAPSLNKPKTVNNQQAGMLVAAADQDKQSETDQVTERGSTSEGGKAGHRQPHTPRSRSSGRCNAGRLGVHRRLLGLALERRLDARHVCTKSTPMNQKRVSGSRTICDDRTRREGRQLKGITFERGKG